jgi:hypothetical protein
MHVGHEDSNNRKQTACNYSACYICRPVNLQNCPTNANLQRHLPVPGQFVRVIRLFIHADIITAQCGAR